MHSLLALARFVTNGRKCAWSTWARTETVLVWVVDACLLHGLDSYAVGVRVPWLLVVREAAESSTSVPVRYLSECLLMIGKREEYL